MAKQVNIFLENRPGRLASVTELLGANGINIRAITIQDRGDYGMMKLLVNQPEKAHLVFTENNFACALKDVLAVRLPDRPGSLSALAKVFGKHGINVLDGYGFVVEEGKSAVWCSQVENLTEIQAIIEREGFEVLGDAELYAL